MTQRILFVSKNRNPVDAVTAGSHFSIIICSEIEISKGNCENAYSANRAKNSWPSSFQMQFVQICAHIWNRKIFLTAKDDANRCGRRATNPRYLRLMILLCICHTRINFLRPSNHLWVKRQTREGTVQMSVNETSFGAKPLISMSAACILFFLAELNVITVRSSMRKP